MTTNQLKQARDDLNDLQGRNFVSLKDRESHYNAWFNNNFNIIEAMLDRAIEQPPSVDIEALKREAISNVHDALQYPQIAAAVKRTIDHLSTHGHLQAATKADGQSKDKLWYAYELLKPLTVKREDFADSDGGLMACVNVHNAFNQIEQAIATLTNTVVMPKDEFAGIVEGLRKNTSALSVAHFLLAKYGDTKSHKWLNEWEREYAAATEALAIARKYAPEGE